MFNYLSATIPNTPPDYEFNQPPEKRNHTAKELQVFVIKVEHLFDLPTGILSTPSKKHFNGVSLSEVKRAAIYHLHQRSEAKLKAIALQFGVKHHTVVLYHIEQAENFLRRDDKIFGLYYEKVKSIAV